MKKQLLAFILFISFLSFINSLFPTATDDRQNFVISPLSGGYCTITRYGGSDSVVTIPDEIDGYIVVSIGENAFRNNENLEIIVLNATIKEIGDMAFGGCSRLTNIFFPYGIERIGEYAFSGCIALVELQLPDSIKDIGYRAFENCVSLSTINYPLNWQTSGGEIFYGCTSLEQIEIPEGVISIPQKAFYGCTSLKRVNIPTSLQIIGKQAFSNCRQLESFEFKDNIKSIEERAFESCVSLRNISINQGCNFLGDYAFAGCTALQKAIIPDTITNINEGIFFDCTALMSIDLWDGIVSIGRYAFKNCTQLKSVKFPESVTDIGYQSFANCSNLETITYPIGWNISGKAVFKDCYKLKSIKIPEGVKRVPDYAFYECNGIESVSLPSTLSQIGQYAFATCQSLADIIIHGDTVGIHSTSFSNPASSLVIYCEKESAAEAYAIEHGISYDNILNKETESEADDDFYYDVEQYRRGYCAYDSILTVFYNIDSTKKDLLQEILTVITYEDQSGVEIAEIPMSPNLSVSFSGAYKADFKVIRGIRRITDISVITIIDDIQRKHRMKDSYWHKIPLNVEGILEVCFGNTNDIGALEDMNVRLYTDQGQLVGSATISSAHNLIFRGLAEREQHKLLITNDGFPFAEIEDNDIRIIAGQESKLDLSDIAMPAYLDIELTYNGEKISDHDITVVFADKTPDKNRLFLPGTRVENLADGDTISYSVKLGPNSEKMFKWDETVYTTTVKAGANHHTIALESYEQKIFSGTLEDASSGYAIDGATLYINWKTTQNKWEGHSITTNKNGEFHCVINDVDTVVTIFKVGYVARTYSISQGEIQENTQISLAKAGGRIELEGLYYGDRTGGTGEPVSIYNLPPSQIQVYNISKDAEVKVNAHEFPVLHTLPGHVSPGDRVVLTIKKEGFEDATIEATADEYGDIKANFSMNKQEYMYISGQSIADEIRIVAPQQIVDRSIVVRGVSPKYAHVEIYDGDVFIGEADANEYGMYEVSVTLVDRGTHAIHNLYARDPNQNVQSQTVQVNIGLNGVILTEFAIALGESLISTQPSKSVAPFSYTAHSSQPIELQAAFDDNSKVAQVKTLVKMSDGGDVVVEMTHDSEKDCYVGILVLEDNQLPTEFSVKYLPLRYESSISPMLVYNFTDEQIIKQEVGDDESYSLISYKLDDVANTPIELAMITVSHLPLQTELENTDEYIKIDGDASSFFVRNRTEYIELDGRDYEMMSIYMPQGDGQYTCISQGVGFQQSDQGRDQLTRLIKNMSPYREAIFALKDFARLLISEEMEDIATRIKNIEQYESIQNILSIYCSRGIGNVESETLRLINTRLTDELNSLVEDIADGQFTERIDSLGNPQISFGYGVLTEYMGENIKTADVKTVDSSTGYVYEVFPENRLPQVKGSLYMENQHGVMERRTARVGHNTDYILTNQLGEFAMDTPENPWQIRLEKEGFFTGYSNKVYGDSRFGQANVALISKEDAEIEEILATDKEIEIRFSKYLLSDTIVKDGITVELDGKDIPIDIVIEDISVSQYGAVTKAVKLMPKLGYFNEGSYGIKASSNIRTYGGATLIDEMFPNVEVMSSDSGELLMATLNEQIDGRHRVSVSIKPFGEQPARLIMMTQDAGGRTLEIQTEEIDSPGAYKDIFTATKKYPAKIKLYLWRGGMTAVSDSVDVMY